MSYKLKFLPTALNEWKKLDNPIQVRFKKKLKDCLASPRIPQNTLSGFENHYKIRLRASGHRLVYEVTDKEICVVGIVAGKRKEDLIPKKHEMKKH